jgi:hypothetical protein
MDVVLSLSFVFLLVTISYLVCPSCSLFELSLFLSYASVFLELVSFPLSFLLPILSNEGVRHL